MSSQSRDQDGDYELDNAQKITLLLLAAQREEPIPGNLWLQKELFLIADELPPLEEYLEYEAHLQGPYSETANTVIENLQYLGLVKKNRNGWALTEEGEVQTNKIQNGSSSKLTSIIQETKSTLNDLSKDELLVYIYYQYPEMTEESMEKDDLESKRCEAAKSLYQRGKVDRTTAAELAGLQEEVFISKIEESG